MQLTLNISPWCQYHDFSDNRIFPERKQGFVKQLTSNSAPLLLAKRLANFLKLKGELTEGQVGAVNYLA